MAKVKRKLTPSFLKKIGKELEELVEPTDKGEPISLSTGKVKIMKKDSKNDCFSYTSEKLAEFPES